MRPSKTAHPLRNITHLSLLILLSTLPQVSVAQQVIQRPDGSSMVIQSGSMSPEQMQALQKQAMEAAKNGGKAPTPGKPPTPGQDKTKESGKEGKGEGGDKKEGDEKLENIKRTAEPPSPPDPQELKVAPDEEGLVKFQFRNQPWPDVLRWYADICNLYFDWQELPGDYINLATQRPHSLEQTGDMINRALLMRGFTMLQDDESLTVVKTEGINPSLVPRIPPSQLTSMPPHRYVRTSFTLNWLLAEEVHEEFASMISKNGKLTPLQSTNRLEAMDAAGNLRDIHDIIEQEQSAIALENLAREFPLQFARAAAVKEQLEAFLGIQSSRGGGSSYMSSSAARMIQQQMQQMQQQMQRAAQSAKGGAAARRKRPEDVYLVANERSNSLIVHAPPNKMAIIASFIKRVDVRNGTATDFQRMSTRMKVFRLASLGPQELVETLTSMDVLEPTTRLQVDEDNNAIIAYASVADQYLINSVIERLDGSERSFQVIQLNRLDAESVAGSIKFLMGAEEEDNSNSRRRYYDPYDFYGRNRSNKKEDKMRVGANVQDNQLLLWVNQIEMDEVNNLLIKLGELPPEGGSKSKVRVIDASRQPETFEYLQRLKEQWDKVSPNPLIIPDETEFVPLEEQESTEEYKTEAPAPSTEQPPAPAQPAEDKITGSDTSPSGKIGANTKSSTASAKGLLTATFQTTTVETGAAQDQATTTDVTPRQSASPNRTVRPVATETPIASEGTSQQGGETMAAQDDPSASDPNAPSSPVRIFLDEGGNLVIQSEDTDALDRLERIMQSNRPPKKPYDIFKVKYARASWVTLNLEEYFDKQKDDDQGGFFGFFFDDRFNDKEEERQLGDRPPLRFIWDNDTQSIVVQGADDQDRKTIKELIALWDVPEPVDEESMRYTELIPIRYSRAENIVNTIKEAYRDLLSANDKTFQDGGEGGDGESKRDGGGSGRGQSRGQSAGGGFNFGGLKGKLSLGPDVLTNSILISAEGKQLLELVVGVIKQLDEAAKDKGAVEVVKVSEGVGGQSLESAIRAMLGAGGAGKRGAPQQNNQPGNGGREQPNRARQEAEARAIKQGQLQFDVRGL